jgi:hypothetical protein
MFSVVEGSVKNGTHFRLIHFETDIGVYPEQSSVRKLIVWFEISAILQMSLHFGTYCPHFLLHSRNVFLEPLVKYVLYPLWAPFIMRQIRTCMELLSQEIGDREVRQQID